MHACPDGDRSALAEHRLAGVDQQIQQNLLKLNDFPRHGQFRLHLNAKGDAVLLRVACHDRQCFVNELLHAERPEDRFPARQPEHGDADPPGLGRALERLGQGLADEVHVRLVALGVLKGRLRIADDGRKNIVELVSDDGGDGADSGQALGFGELFAQEAELLLHGSELAGDGLFGNFGGTLRVAHVKASIGAGRGES